MKEITEFDTFMFKLETHFALIFNQDSIVFN